MRKTDKIIAITFVAIVSLILFMAQVVEDRQNVYVVPDFQGGLNVSTDGTGLQPDEALTLTNLTLDTVGVLVPRQGFSYWDSAAIDETKEISAIYIYEPYEDTLRMIIASSGYIYKIANLSDPGDVNWDTLRFSFTDDSLKVIEGNATVRRPSPSWWYTKVGAGNKISMFGDTSSTEYVIYYTWDGNDTTITLLSTYKGASADSTTFTIYLRMPTTGDIIPSLTQHYDKLFIGNEGYYAITYDDTNYTFIALIDSGIVVDTIQHDSTKFIYSGGKAHVGGRFVYSCNDALWGDTTGVLPGDAFTYYYSVINHYTGLPIEYIFHSSIKDTITIRRMELNDYLDGWESALDYCNNYAIRRKHYSCTIDSGGYSIVDTAKNWQDFEYGDMFFNTFYAVEVDSGYSKIKRIYCNDDSSFAVYGKLKIGDYYYIFSAIPRSLATVDTTYKEFPRFEQVIFHGNQLYGIGFDRTGYTSPKKHNYNRIWYSDILMSSYMPYNYNFDLAGSENTSGLFSLRGDLYVSSDISIWRSSGMPRRRLDSGNQLLTNVVSNMGIPDIDNWAKATEEYGYFTNRTGVYRFDGVRPQKISWRVDPIIKNNYASRIVMGYQDYRLYISFPDSNFTLVYDERFDAFYKLDFGITCFYAPADTNIFYFGHSEFKGRVYYYPNDLFQDIVAIDDTNDIAIEYESGWQSHGGYWTVKSIKDMYFPVKSSNTPTIKIYTDFSATACDTVLCDSTGRFVYRKQFDNDCVGEYFKVAFSDSIDALTIFGGYRIEYVEELQWQK